MNVVVNHNQPVSPERDVVAIVFDDDAELRHIISKLQEMADNPRPGYRVFMEYPAGHFKGSDSGAHVVKTLRKVDQIKEWREAGYNG